jgi:BASS family bile acid:Na+ symporter
MTRDRIAAWLPGLALLVAGLAWAWPGLLAPLAGAVVPLLACVMIGMGLALPPRALAAVAARPGIFAVGFALHFLVMPAVGYLVARLLHLSEPLLIGMVLVGSCPAGTASNVMCFLARGDLALSIAITTATTLAAVLMTPALLTLYLGHTVPIPAGDMVWSLIQIVILPVAAGYGLKTWLRTRRPALELALEQAVPLLSIACVLLLIGIVVAMNRMESGPVAPPFAVFLGVALHNLLGLAIGYGVARGLRLPIPACRAIAIEVGMQNSGLAVALAIKYFSAASALPGAIFSVWHNLSGATLAGYWARRPPPDAARAGPGSGAAPYPVPWPDP